MASAYYNEIDPFAVQWLQNLIKRGLIAPGEVDDRSIEDVAPADLFGFDQCHFFAGIGIWSHSLRQAGWADNRKVWTGSCPCQPFSTAGKGDGTADERHLWPAFHYLIQECRPEFVLGEQVEAAIRHGWLDTLQADLEGIGYTSGAVVLPAAGVGAPHIRSRIWWVGYANDEGLEGHARDGNHGGRSDSTGSATSSGLSVGGVGNTDEHGRSSGSQAAEAPGYWSPTDTAGRTNGFWRDAAWLPFENAKQRPVEPKFIWLANGDSCRMERVRDLSASNHGNEEREIDASKNQRVSREVLLPLPEAYEQEEVQRSSGGLLDVLQEEVLQSDLYGPCNGGSCESSDGTQREKAGNKDGETVVRDVREDEGRDAHVRSSQGPKSDQQRSREFANFVRVLPRSYSLAKLHGDSRTEEELLILLKTSGAERLVQHPSYKAEEIWRSFTEEVQGRVRMGFEKGCWVRSFESPVVDGGPLRMGELHAYGNAIVAPLATEFIKAVMACKPD